MASDLEQHLCDPLGEDHATGLKTDQDYVFEAAVALRDLVGDPAQRTLDVFGGENLGPGNEDPTTRRGQPSFSLSHLAPLRAGLAGPASRSGFDRLQPAAAPCRDFAGNARTRASDESVIEDYRNYHAGALTMYQGQGPRTLSNVHSEGGARRNM